MPDTSRGLRGCLDKIGRLPQFSWVMSNRQYKVALAQMVVSPDPAANLEKAEAAVEEAARSGARIVCLPELFRSQYFCQQEDAALFDLAGPIPGPVTDRFGAIAAKRNIVVIAPLFERRAAGLYHNSVTVIDADGSIAGVYRKMHIPDDPLYYEKFYFTPGDLGFKAFDTKAGRIGVLICWDQWYPEAARLVALQGADIIFYPTAIGWHPREKAKLGAVQLDAWRTVQRGHAIANGVYVAAVNRVGFEKTAGGDGLEFWGSSFIADPQGVVLAEASAEKSEIISVTVDLDRLETIRRNWPFLRDRRIEAYGGLTSRYLDQKETNT